MVRSNNYNKRIKTLAAKTFMAFFILFFFSECSPGHAVIKRIRNESDFDLTITIYTKNPREIYVPQKSEKDFTTRYYDSIDELPEKPCTHFPDSLRVAPDSACHQLKNSIMNEIDWWVKHYEVKHEKNGKFKTIYHKHICMLLIENKHIEKVNCR